MNDQFTLKITSNIVSSLFGAILILLGIVFLLGRYVSALFNFDSGHYVWPFFIIIPGLLMFLASFVFERRVGLPMAIIGGMITAAGGILFLQNLFDLYASWAYAWALVAPTSVGIAKVIYGALRGLGDEVKSGLSLSGIGFAMFVIGGFFFEMVIGINGFGFGMAWQCWPGLLIGLGMILLLSNLLPRRNPPST
jgi:cell wall-active antibiotic response 4TMS protein YvqF